jgi:hypothetical protein
MQQSGSRPTLSDRVLTSTKPANINAQPIDDVAVLQAKGIQMVET